MIKPDGVQRNLIGDIIKRFEQRGFKLIAMKFFIPSRALVELHYAEHRERAFFPGLVTYLCSGPVCAMVWEGNNVVSISRAMMGSTKPSDSAPGTIRGDFGIEVGRNVIHGSSAPEEAAREIHLWFGKEEFVTWNKD